MTLERTCMACGFEWDNETNQCSQLCELENSMPVLECAWGVAHIIHDHYRDPSQSMVTAMDDIGVIAKIIDERVMRVVLAEAARQ